MLTQCPACGTVFRITEEQINMRAGRVRCGQCQHAFDALDTLIDEPARDVVAAISQEGGLHGVSPTPTFYAAEENLSPAPATPSPAGIGDAQADGEAEKPPTDILLDELPPWPPIPVAAATTHRWAWLIGSLLLLITLGIQAAWVLRAELTSPTPAARPLLVNLCQLAGCTVGLPAKVDLVGIEASDLHPDPMKPGRLMVSATLKNRATFNQQFPHLELTLTDVADKVIARKALTPADYLPPKTPLASGMQPNADIAVNFAVDIGQLSANGYRLYLFYP